MINLKEDTQISIELTEIDVKEIRDMKWVSGRIMRKISKGPCKKVSRRDMGLIKFYGKYRRCCRSL